MTLTIKFFGMSEWLLSLLYISLLTCSCLYADQKVKKNKITSEPVVELVDILSINPNIQLDIRYATSNNFLGVPVYSKAACYLHKDVAAAVSAIQNELEAHGLSLKIFDGYRPLSVQQLMWDTIQDERYVSNPAKNKGRHTRGTAVDVTLVDKTGKDLEMPSEFDDFTEKAHSDFQQISSRARKNRKLLKTVMEKYGFQQLSTEWWHFDFSGWNDDLKYPPLDISFDELESRNSG